MFRYTIICSLVVATLLGWPAGARAASHADPAAESVVEAYMDALSVADVQGMLSTMADPWREEMRPTLESNGYPDFLARLYAGSTYTIEGSQPAVDGGILVSTQMQLDDGLARTFQFRVEPQEDGSYRIAEELQ